MITQYTEDRFDDVLRNYNTQVKIHTIRSLEVDQGLHGATIVEVEVWRPVGSFQVILKDAEVERYGRSEALDRCLRNGL